MADWQIDTITLPGDLLWSDELTWTDRKQVERNSLAGGMIRQRSTKTGGRAITLTTRQGVFVTRQQVDDLNALADNPATDTFTVTHPDGRTFLCAFRYGGQAGPVDAAAIFPKDTPDPADICNLTLRLMIL